jgi:integrase/recombinase XerD
MKNSSVMENAILDFMLSREAKMCTRRTLDWYSYHLGRINEWLKENGVFQPEEINSGIIRSFLSDLGTQNLSSSYINGYARILRTFTRFLFKEGYITEEIVFDMPKLIKRRQRVYSVEEVKKILKACKNKRDRAFILFMVDSGIRLGEVLALNWENINLNNGIVRIDNGKGGKFRTVVVSPKTRQALVKYKSEIEGSDFNALFQTIHSTRFTESGLRSWMNRLSKKAGVHIAPHALRRSFATLSVKAGMDLFRLQALMGHSSLEMTKSYVRTLDEDLLEAHQKHSPINLVLNQ